MLQSVLVSVFYSKPQRLDVYVANGLVAPTNAKWNTDNTDYTLKEPIYPGTSAENEPGPGQKRAKQRQTFLNLLKTLFYQLLRQINLTEI